MFVKTLLFSALAAAVVGTAITAQAGETLRLKAGSVDPITLVESAASRSRMSAKVGKAYYVVQFASQIHSEDQLNLKTLGAKVVRYMPDDALVVQATEKIARTIETSSAHVRAVVAFRPEWKMSSDMSASSVFTARLDEVVLVRLFPGENGPSASEKIQLLQGVEVVSVNDRSLVVRAKRPQADSIAEIEAVEWVQPLPIMRPMHFDLTEGDTGPTPAPTPSISVGGDYSDLTGLESGTKLMKFESAWSRGLTGKGQIVAMADTGLDSGDKDALSLDFMGRVPAGFSFGMFASSWEDPMGHGTHVAGSVMSSGEYSGGRLKGGAFEAQLVAEGMWSPLMGNLTVPPKLMDLFGKAYDSGARIHTNSWGSPRNLGAYDGFAQQVDEYMVAHPDMLVIFAAGNSGVDKDKDGRVDAGSVSSPGTAKNALTVGASKNVVFKGGMQKKLSETRVGAENWGAEPLFSSKLSENEMGLAPFSSRGPTADGRMKPEVVAPGTNILSARSHHKDSDGLWGIYNKDYVWSGGTSMSTPLTAGAAAVVRQYLIEDRKIAVPSAALIKAALIHTSFDLFPGQFGEVGKEKGQELLTVRPNPDAGWGRVNVEEATHLAGSVVVDERTGLAMGETHTYPVTVERSGKLIATLVYTDAPGAAGAAAALVNDLDLVVVDAAGKETALNDRLNNTEMVETAVAAGKLEIRVKATYVPQGLVAGKQPYALIVSVK
jgi:subtilisin family serine protease